MTETMTLLQRAVDEKGPAYRYGCGPDGELLADRACVYAEHADNGTAVPSCIVGHVFHYLGVSMQWILDDYDEAGNQLNAESVDQVLSTIEERFGLDFDPQAMALLSDAQDMQDTVVGGTTRRPWGKILNVLQANR